MKVLITGGTGFTGAQTARILLNEGKDTPVLFDLNPSAKLLDDIKDDIEIIQGDLGNFGHVLDVVKKVKPEVIYHLGGMLSISSDANPAAAISANAFGTYHILEAAKLFEVRQVLFSSTIGTYGYDIQEDVINDHTLQRPVLFYGATKVFCEHMGLFYKKKYGLDFRCIRYPSLVGPGVKAPGVAQYTSWTIEESFKGNAFTINLNPETRMPIIYYKDAARAIVKLGKAPVKNIKTVNYLIDGFKPVPTAMELSQAVKAKIPDALINFKPDIELQKIVDRLILPLDDSNAKKEWAWDRHITRKNS